jgi:DNA repair protein RadC
MSNNNFELEQVSVRLNNETPLYSNEVINTAEDAVRIVGRQLMAHLDREQICIINLNAANNPINFSITSIGGLKNALVEPREMLKASILSNAGSVIMLHNHPSGNIKASKEDYQITEQMINSFNSVGIKLLDHIIVGGNNLTDLYSFRENNIKMFEEYRMFSGELKFSDISEELIREIDVFLVAEDLVYWINNTHSTISLTNEEAEMILNYMDGHGYNLGVDEGKLVRIDVDAEEPTIEPYSINDAIYAVCDWNADLISETDDKIKSAYSVEEVYKLREYKKTLRADEDVLDELFKKTSLGKTLELGIVKDEEKQTKYRKERVM